MPWEGPLRATASHTAPGMVHVHVSTTVCDTNLHVFLEGKEKAAVSVRREPCTTASARQLADSAVHGSSASSRKWRDRAAAVEFRVAAIHLR